MFESLTDALREDHVEQLTRADLHDRFVEVRKVEAAIAAYRSRLVTATNRLGDRGLDGAGMLRSVGRMSSRAAGSIAKTAESLETLPAVAAALSEGQITAEHATVLAAAAEKVDPVSVEAELVPADSDVPPVDIFRKRTREWVAAHQSPSAGDDELSRQRRHRDYVRWEEDGMWKFLFSTDSVNGPRVAARLEQRMTSLWRDDGGRDAGPDARTSGQRGADAFVELVLAEPREPGASSGGGPARVAPPQPKPAAHFNVVVDLRRLSDDPEGVALAIADGAALPQSVLELLACNSSLTPMIFDGPGRPLWVGRDHRTATVAQWRALIARDRGCVGCGAAPDRCEAHHVVAWRDFGFTDIDNLVLVCSRCHHDLHDRGAVLRRRSGRWVIEGRAGPTPIRDPDARPTPDALFAPG